MRTRRISSSNRTVAYVIAIAVIIIAFLLLGGGPWMRGMMHGGRSMGITHLNWTQILIGFGLGFLLGYVIFRRK
jgi:hypothetical protein